MNLQLLPVLADRPHRLIEPLAEFLTQLRGSSSVVKVGFAYATLGGVDRLQAVMAACQNWSRVRKQFLIGLHHGITEPAALEQLRGISGAEVRVTIPGNRLSAGSLVVKPMFHAKIMAVTGHDGRIVKFLHAGSANLTSSGVGLRPQNHEFSVAVSASDADGVDTAEYFAQWWTRLWRSAVAVDSSLIRRYAQVRRGFLRQYPILRSVSDPPERIGTARAFFCEVGAASGPPGMRHQVEFPRSLARFFGRVVRRRRDLVLRSRGKSWRDRPLSYKRTTFRVDIWRLGMPTQNAGGEPIAQRAVAFFRTDDPDTFDFRVADVGSQTYERWVAAANLSGHLGMTHGGRPRQFGFF